MTALERISLLIAWAFFRGLFLAFYYPMVGLGRITVWLAEGLKA